MDSTLNCKVIRSKKRKKTISLHIDGDGCLVIHAPHRLPSSVIQEFLASKSGWIDRKRRQRQLEREHFRPKEFAPGEEFLYQGNLFPLEIAENRKGRHPLEFTQDRFVLRRKALPQARDHFCRWYRNAARQVITQKLEQFGAALGLVPQGLTITGARRRWGSCSPRDRLSFSWRIVMAPPDILDYVILHELVHMKEKNHSKRFWGRLERVFPDYRVCRRWLRENAGSLDF